MEAEEDEDMKVKDNEDENDAEIIHPYEEANPLNRPPPSPETAEQGFMNAPVSQSTLQPIPPFRQFAALDSTLREQIQEMKKLMAELNEWFQQIQERDLRAKNEMLRIRLRAAEEKAKYKLIEAEYYKNHFAYVSWYYKYLSGWEYKIRNQLP
nr:hypothetical protein [Tanacetum cinerariifolium]